MPPRIRRHLRRVVPYEWEASSANVAAATGLSESDVVRFDMNTSPWPPAAWERTVLDVARLPVNEYPHPSNEPLRSAIARREGVEPNQVVVTCGADEALGLVARAFLGPGSQAVLPTPSFSMFRVVTETVGARILEVPLGESWQVQEEALLQAVRDPRVAVVWLCSPNNPTGTTLNLSLLEAVADAVPDTAVVMDEAYYEFWGTTAVPLIPKRPNLVVIRTFSKAYGLAGARVGYAISSVDMARAIDLVRPPQNLTQFGIVAACHALEDRQELRQRVENVKRERAKLQKALEARGWCAVPSEANFILARPPSDPRSIARALQATGLVVRTYSPDHPRLSTWLRVTVRAPEENNRLLARLDALSG